MTAQVVFHVGTHKTGTTALQHALWAGRHALERAGIRYPSAGTQGPGHHLLAWAAAGKGHLLGGRDPVAVLEECARAVAAAGSHRVLFSSEELENLNAERVEYLRTALGVEDARAIIYFRPQVDFLVAQYKQHVQQPQTRYGGTLVDYLVELSFMERMAYPRIARHWEKVLGRGALTVRVYDRQAPSGQDIVTDFCGLLDVEPALLGRRPVETSAANRALPDVSIEVLRRLNRQGLDGRERKRVLGLLHDLSPTSPEGFALIDGRTAWTIWKRFLPANEKLVELYGITSDALLREPSIAPEVRSLQCVDHPVIDVLADALLRLARA